jgi:hypothetical protein
MLDRTITILTSSRETLDGVQQYLRRAGARASGASRPEEIARANGRIDAVLFFADDYSRAEAKRVFESLQRDASIAVLVVITASVDEFRVARDSDPRVIVLRRPAWGWMLVDAIRGE